MDWKARQLIAGTCAIAATRPARGAKRHAARFHTCDGDRHWHHDAVVMCMTYMSMVVAAVVANMVTSMIMTMVMSQLRSGKSISYRLSSSVQQRAMRNASQTLSFCTQEKTKNPRVGRKNGP